MQYLYEKSEFNVFCSFAGNIGLNDRLHYPNHNDCSFVSIRFMVTTNVQGHQKTQTTLCGSCRWFAQAKLGVKTTTIAVVWCVLYELQQHWVQVQTKEQMILSSSLV